MGQTNREKVRCLFRFLIFVSTSGIESGVHVVVSNTAFVLRCAYWCGGVTARTRLLAWTRLFLWRQSISSPLLISSCLKAMPELPANVEKYSQLPSVKPAFTATTIPGGLKKNHTTKTGAWGVIRVFQGLLEYTIEGSESFELSSSYPGIIEPGVKHRVKALSDDVEFAVEFYREVDDE